MMKEPTVMLAIAGMCIAFWGCETRDCLKWQTIYSTRQVCTSYSDTGHCRAYATEPFNYEACAEYAPEPEAVAE